MTAKQAIRALDELYASYLRGTPDQARASMLAADSYVEFLELDREYTRFCQHARLHCLASALGQLDDAYLEFVKARYWYLMSQEANNAIPRTELVEKTKAMTEQRCDQFVIEFDAANTDKKGGANFWKTVPGGPVSPAQWLAKQYKE